MRMTRWTRSTAIWTKDGETATSPNVENGPLEELFKMDNIIMKLIRVLDLRESYVLREALAQLYAATGDYSRALEEYLDHPVPVATNFGPHSANQGKLAVVQVRMQRQSPQPSTPTRES